MLKAGGSSGLNLTAASHVLHFDRWWNPAVENQATDRAFRIGQKRNVMVHKFVCRGTVEERIDALGLKTRRVSRPACSKAAGVKVCSRKWPMTNCCASSLLTFAASRRRNLRMSWEWDYQPYVSAAEKKARALKAARTLEKKGRKLSPICCEGKGRKMARNFWGVAWCDNLESYTDYANRLPRGRNYVRNGSVVDLQITPGVITALISGSSLYTVTIRIKPVPAGAWRSLKADCSGQVGSLMDLLQGRLAGPVMEIITRRQTGLFPKPAEIELDCSCPDWAGMCKHVAATLYAVGVRLDDCPELLFALRGADHLELISAATESVTASGPATARGSDTLAGEDLAEVFGIERSRPSKPFRKNRGKVLCVLQKKERWH